MSNNPQVKSDPGKTTALNAIEQLRNDLLSDNGIRERISLRAYELYEKRGGEHNRDLEDWFQAQEEILSPLIQQEMKPPLERGKSEALPAPKSKGSAAKA